MKSISHPAYIVWDLNPRIFDQLEFLRWYGLMWGIGVMLAYLIMQHIYTKENKPAQELEKLALYVMLGVVIGARLGHVLFYDPVYYWHHPLEVLPFRLEPHFQFTGLAGLASHGGVMGALLGLYLHHRRYNSDYLWLLDRLAIVSALLGSFIRFGNFLNSEIVGTPTSMFWGIIFTRVDQQPRHPAQLYEASFYLAIFALLFALWQSGKTRRYTGFLFGLGLSLIFLQRLIVEFFKEAQSSFENDMVINMGQILSIPMILAGVAILVLSLKSSKQPFPINSP